ncbi:response regulator [Spirosoma oryzicola]|uniref:response regulator n=1 Tax=Spirosoma oryzicola TaxID=2898794 RepID=UPI001E43C97F|nr:response regulator [Spirosoma oryzicola]UHG93589.1 response regulator [Spirosoma oryzicola]
MTPLDTDCVFLVDDDEDDRFLVQQVFKQLSPECQIKSLFNGEQLINALATAPVLPSLILLDLNMPFMSGMEALRFIRREPKYQSIAIVILTTSSNPFDQQQALKLGANDFITKPADIKGLNKVILQLRQNWLLGNCITSCDRSTQP